MVFSVHAGVSAKLPSSVAPRTVRSSPSALPRLRSAVRSSTSRLPARVGIEPLRNAVPGGVSFCQFRIRSRLSVSPTSRCRLPRTARVSLPLRRPPERFFTKPSRCSSNTAMRAASVSVSGAL